MTYLTVMRRMRNIRFMKRLNMSFWRTKTIKAVQVVMNSTVHHLIAVAFLKHQTKIK
jgi:hypothetical protein